MVPCKDISMVAAMMKDAELCLDSAATSLTSVHNNLDQLACREERISLVSKIDRIKRLEDEVKRFFVKLANWDDGRSSDDDKDVG